MPEGNEASVKARRISHTMKQVRKRATVSSAGTSGKPGSVGAEQSLRARKPQRSGDVGAGSDGGETALPDQQAAAAAQSA